VGILWDLGTFWPRATHPLAPPCYMERALPDLCARISWLTSDVKAHVVLSAHSQGTVMAAAVVLQSPPEQRARLSLLTAGSPLQRLYSRFFPAYFGADVLEEVSAALRGGPSGPSRDSRDCRDSRDSRWRNLYRWSDPVGGPVLTAREPCEQWYGDAVDADRREQHVRDAGVDVNLLDPVFACAAGDRAWPGARGHSGYYHDPYFEAAVEVMVDRARTTVPRARDGSDDLRA
jgi:hypothetical protein